MFNCEKCGAVLVEDAALSCVAYDKATKELLDENGALIHESLPDELVFVCRRCGFTREINLLTIIRSIKERIASRLLDTRLQIVYNTVDRTLVDEANGVSFCGLCPGTIDDTGICYNDVIKQCPIRRNKFK